MDCDRTPSDLLSLLRDAIPTSKRRERSARKQGRPAQDQAWDTPQILAIADVHLPAVSGTTAEAVTTFYADVIGLQPFGRGDRDSELVFRGFPPTTPRLTVDLATRPPDNWCRRCALIQVQDLNALKEQLDELGIGYELLRGWYTYDRRLLLSDPAENLIELVAVHRF